VLCACVDGWTQDKRYSRDPIWQRGRLRVQLVNEEDIPLNANIRTRACPRCARHNATLHRTLTTHTHARQQASSCTAR
jgi:hypothetical protein